MFVLLCFLMIQKTDPHLQERLVNIEQRLTLKTVNKEDFQHFTVKTENRFEEERNYTDRQFLTMESRMASLERYKNSLLLMLSCVGVGGLLSLFALYKSFTSALEKRLATEFKTREETIKRIIEKASNDHRILDNTRLLILSLNPETTQEALKQQGFQHIMCKRVDETGLKKPADYGESSYDLVIFDQLPENIINLYVAQSSKSHFVCYSESYLTLQNKQAVNCANSPITLFHQILQTARYLEHMKKMQRV